MLNSTRNLISVLFITIAIALIIYGVILLYSGNENIANNEPTNGHIAIGGALLGIGIAAIILTILFSVNNKIPQPPLYNTTKVWQNTLIILLILLIITGVGVGGYFLLKNV